MMNKVLVFWLNTKTNDEYYKIIKHINQDYFVGFINQYSHMIVGLYVIDNGKVHTLDEYNQLSQEKYKQSYTIKTKFKKRNERIDNIINFISTFKK